MIPGRRLFRRARKFATGTSLVLCLLASVFWIRSLHNNSNGLFSSVLPLPDCIQIRDAHGRMCAMWSIDGELSLCFRISVLPWRTPKHHLYAARSWRSLLFYKLPVGWTLYDDAYDHARWPWMLYMMQYSPRLELPGVEFESGGYETSAQMRARAAPVVISGWVLRIRYWILVLFTALLPGVEAFRLVRRRSARPGTCQVCGYDLRETPARCPECGTRTNR